jgi:hypothetical protein
MSIEDCFCLFSRLRFLVVFLHIISEGSYAEVSLYKHRNSEQLFAIKKDKSKGINSLKFGVKNEGKVMIEAQKKRMCKNIIHVHDCLTEDENTYLSLMDLFFVMHF